MPTVYNCKEVEKQSESPLGPWMKVEGHGFRVDVGYIEYRPSSEVHMGKPIRDDQLGLTKVESWKAEAKIQAARGVMGKEHRLTVIDSKGSMGGESSGVKQRISTSAQVMHDTRLETYVEVCQLRVCAKGCGTRPIIQGLDVSECTPGQV